MGGCPGCYTGLRTLRPGLTRTEDLSNPRYLSTSRRYDREEKEGRKEGEKGREGMVVDPMARGHWGWG